MKNKKRKNSGKLGLDTSERMLADTGLKVHWIRSKQLLRSWFGLLAWEIDG
jgi:hypothetical protein